MWCQSIKCRSWVHTLYTNHSRRNSRRCNDNPRSKWRQSKPYWNWPRIAYTTHSRRKSQRCSDNRKSKLRRLSSYWNSRRIASAQLNFQDSKNLESNACTRHSNRSSLRYSDNPSLTLIQSTMSLNSRHIAFESGSRLCSNIPVSRWRRKRHKNQRCSRSLKSILLPLKPSSRFQYTVLDFACFPDNRNLSGKLCRCRSHHSSRHYNDSP